MTRSIQPVIVGLLLGLLLPSPTGMAQEQGRRALPSRPPASQVAGGPVHQPTGDPLSHSQPLISVDTPPGTVRDYIQAVQAAAAPHPVNVSLPEEAAAVAMPAVSLKQVSPYIALLAISTAFPHGGPHEFAVRPITEDPNSTPLYAVQYQHARRQQVFTADGRPVHAGSRMTEVFSLRELLTPAPGGDADSAPDPSMILSAIEATLRMTKDDAQPADVRFHEESGLLIVRGSGEDIAAVRRIIELMSNDAAQRSRRGERSFTTQKFILSHASPQFVVQSLGRAFPGVLGGDYGGVQATGDQGSSSVIVDARSDLATAVRALVIALDQPANQGEAGELAENRVLLDRLQREIETLRDELTRSTQQRIEAEERGKALERQLNR